jgi:2-polyprenyl-6-methoxyphenol hydroxylase-like FAD-dependent oxidoreductase
MSTILIAGGGIGGLSAAISLKRAGHRVTVFESAKTRQSVQEFGGGIVLWHNAMRALAALGVAEEVLAAGSRVTRAEQLTWTGRPLGSLPVARLDRHHGIAAVSINRLEIYRVLSAPLDETTVLLGHPVVAFSQDASGVRVRLEGGEEVAGDLLVLADGRRSALRAPLGLPGAEFPPYAGYAHWSAVVRLRHPSAPEGYFPLVWGPLRQFYAFHLGGDEIYWAGTEFTAAKGRDEGDMKEAVLRRFGSWVAPVPQLIEATPGEDIHRRDISGGVPLDHWGEGRVTLLGDAAHALTVTLGQGAAMAIEDAVVLGRALATPGDPVAALRRYERARQPRTARLMRLQVSYEKDAAEASAIGRTIRDFFMRRAFHPALVGLTGYYKAMAVTLDQLGPED